MQVHGRLSQIGRELWSKYCTSGLSQIGLKRPSFSIPVLFSHWMQAALGRGKAALCSLSRPWINYQLYVSAYHTLCNWTANPSLRKDLGDTSLCQPQAQTGNNWNVYQLKNRRFNWRLNSALFVQHARNFLVFHCAFLWTICPRATTDPILASTWFSQSY